MHEFHRAKPGQHQISYTCIKFDSSQKMSEFSTDPCQTDMSPTYTPPEIFQLKLPTCKPSHDALMADLPTFWAKMCRKFVDKYSSPMELLGLLNL